MDITKLVKDLQRAIDSLRSEQEEIDAKIASMEKALSSLGESSAPRRGRPRKAASAATRTVGGRSRKKPNWTPEAREAARERMRKYWAKKRSTKKATTRKKTTRKKAVGKKRVSKKTAAVAASE